MSQNNVITRGNVSVYVGTQKSKVLFILNGFIISINFFGERTFSVYFDSDCKSVELFVIILFQKMNLLG